jgi:hypothetical protein
VIHVDANVLVDIWQPDPPWQQWSSNQLRTQSEVHNLAINPVIYLEVSASFKTVSRVDRKLEELEIDVLNIPRHAAFLAGKAFLHYRRRGGIKSNVLPNFFIGAHAAVLNCSVVTRDPRFYSVYFPTVPLITP